MADQYPTRAGILYMLGLILLFFPGYSSFAQVNFAQSELDFNGNGNVNDGVTSLMYGPDGRLYVAEYPGTIKILTIQRNSATDYEVTAVESLSFVKDIINYDDDGTPCSGTTNDCESRETIGITVTGTANNPVVYVTSSDFRIGAGSGGGNGDVDLDTNSGVITRLTWDGNAWDVVDIVRGLPRSEENHATNGLEVVNIAGVEHLIVASGGITNAGGPSTNFVYTCEYALSGAVLSVNLDMLNSMPVKIDGNGRQYIYDLPTLDDPTRPNANGIEDPNNSSYDGIDVNDPWGGNDGLNQAVVVPGGPVQIYSPGYRNAYDLVVTESGALYVTDNGANQGWGGFPVSEGGGSATNAYDPAEPGSNTTSGGEQIDNVDHLELVTTDIQSYVPNSFYAGHPNPVRANPSGAGLYTNFSGTTAFRTQTYDPNGSTPGSTSNANIALPANWPPVPVANPVEGDWRGPTVPNPDGPDDVPVLTWTTNTNGIDEYTASNFGGAMQGDLIAGKNGGILRRVELNANGTVANYTASFGSGLGGNPLGITCNSDLNPFPGTIWAGTLNGKIIVLEPADLVECFVPGDPEYDPNADYDSDGYTNQDEADNGTDPCNGGSQPNDFDKSAGGALVSDLNDSDDDNDGVIDANDPFQLGNPNIGGSDAFAIPILNGLFNDQQGLGGIFGLGMTGLMNNGDSNPNWLDWLDDRGQGPNPDDVLGGAPGLMTSHMTAGTANGSINTQEKGYQYGVQVDQSTGQFTVSGNLINFDAPLQLYGNTAAVGGELGLFIGDGTQSNFIKFVINTNGLSALQEINDVPGTPINFNIPVANRPQSVVLFYFVVDPSNGLIILEYSLDNGPRTQLGTITAQGNVLTAIQQSNTDLAVGFIGTSNTAGVELEGTWDFLNVVPGDGTTSYRINAGGPTVNATDNEADWEANSVGGSYTGVTYSVNTGNKFNSNLLFANKHSSIPSYIDASTFNAIFAKERWDSANGAEMEFSIPLNNGQYTVNLYLGNSFSGTSQVGQRIFDIFIEGNLAKDNLDLISEFGHQSGGMLSFDTSVSDGELNISFGHVLENPLVNAIEVFTTVATGTPIFVGPIADQNNVEGENLNGSLGVIASGGDGNLSYVMSGQPPGVFIEPTNGQIGGTINSGSAANSPYNVSITVDDNDGETNDAVTINFVWNVSAPGSCTWTDLAQSSADRFETRVEQVDKKIYNIGGWVQGLQITSLNEIYEPETDTWSTVAPIPVAVTHSGSVVVGTDIWIIGGFTGNHPGVATDIVQIYNTVSDSWSNGPSLPALIGSGASTYLNNKIHFFGGLLPDRQTDIGDHYVLDLDNISAGWVPAAPIPVPMNHHWAETLNGVIYSIGGQTGHDGPKVYLDLVYAYDANTDTWSQVASLPRKRSHLESSTSVHDGTILITGGRDINYFFDDVLQFDPVADTWTEICLTPEPLLAPLGVAYNNSFLLNGGLLDDQTTYSADTRMFPLLPGTVFSPLQINPVADRIEDTGVSPSFIVTSNGGDPFADFSYFMEGQPDGVSIDVRTGAVSGTIQANAGTGGPNNDGIHNVVVRVTKPGSTWVESGFTWTVNGTGGWFVKSEDPNYIGRHECGFVQAGDKFYLMGGRESSSVEMYDYSNDTWTNLGDAPINLNHFQGITYQGLIWVIGALQEDNFPVDTPADHVWAFSPANNEWIQGPEIPAARKRGAAGLALYNDKFYVLGGNTNGHDGGYVSWFDEFDPTTGIWTSLSDAPRPRDHFYASVIGDKLYALGGRLSGGPGGVFNPAIPEVDVYDFTSGTWSSLPAGSNIPTPRAGPITSVFNGKLVVMGGSVKDQDVYGTLTTDVLTLTEEFDPLTETWTRIEDSNFKRRATQGIVSGNGIYTTAGSNTTGGGNQKNMEYYGEDNPQGTPLIASNLSGPGQTQIPFGQPVDINLDVADGNTSILIRSVEITGPNAADFNIDVGDLNFGLLLPDSQHTITISFSGTGNASTADLEINYGANSQLVVPLQGPVNNNLDWVDKTENENYTARHECSFVQAGDKFYLMGGRENSRTIDVYNYTNDTWNALTDSAPMEFNHFQATEYEGLIWVLGSFNTNTFPNEVPAEYVWIFDPATEEWMQGPQIPANRRRGSSGLSIYNNKFYIVGGNTDGHDGGYVPWFDEYDPATGTWTPLADAPRARDHFHAAVIGDKLYAAGGRLSGGAGGVFAPTIPEVDVYDFTTSSWSTLPAGQNLPTERAAVSTVNFNEKLVVIGGEIDSQSTALNVTEEYDPLTQSWNQLDDLNHARHGTQAIVSGNGIFITAGSPNKGGGSQKNMEYLGIDNPVGSASTSSSLSAPTTSTIVNGTNSLINLTSSGGNLGVLVTSLNITGTDASEFNILTGNLINGLIEANSIHSVSIAYTGSIENASATLEINYGLSDQITVALTGNTTSTGNGVVSLTLMNADNDTDLFDLTEGLVIDESIVQGINLAIRANTNPTVVGSVFLDLSGPTSNTQTENAEPYALFGNSGSDYNGVLFPSGSYSMSATAYSERNQNGTNLGSLTVQFEIGTGGSTNNPPVVNNPGTQNNTEGDAISLQIVANDESSSLSYTASGLPPGLNIDPNSGLISGTLPLDTGGSGFVEQSGSVVIDAESGTLVPNWSQTTTGGATGIIAGSNHFSNQNGGTIPYEVTITTPGVYRFNWRSFYSGSEPTEENDNWLRFPNDNDVWFFGIKGTVTDEAGIISNLQGAQNNIVFPKGSSRVTSGTTPNGNGGNGYFKVFRSGGNSEVYKWQAVTSDNDGHKIYVWFVNPGTYTFEISERSLGHAIDRVALYKIDSYGDTYSANNFTNAPESPQGGGSALGSPYTVDVTVTDDGVPILNSTEQFIWNVTQGIVNQPPTAIASASPLSGDSALQVNFTGSTSFDDVAVTSFFWDFKDGNTSTLSDPVYTFNTPGTYVVELTVQDAGGLSDSDTVTITVTDPNVNEPPIAVASATPLSGDFPLQVNFTGSNSTDDGGISSYSWDFGDGGNSNLADPVYTYNSAGNFIATLTVTDGEGLENSTALNIDAIDPNLNGVVSFTLINADSDLDLYNLSEGMQIEESTISGINLAIRANTNPAVVGSVFMQISGPINTSATENAAAYALFGNSGSNYFGQTFPVGLYTMSATAYSGSNQSGTNLGSLSVQFEVVVVSTPQPPVANAGPDQSITLPSNSVLVNGSGSDPDGGSIVSYVWNQESGPGTATLSGENTANLSADDLVAGTYVFRLTVTDDESDTGLDDMSVTVQNQPTVEVRINSGGPSFNFGGDTWAADQNFSTSNSFTNVTPINATTNDQLYQSERYARPAIGSFTYNIPVPNGTYDLNLHFAEIWIGAPGGGSGGVGSRIFNVDIENGQNQLSNYDVVASAGGSVTAVIESFTSISVNDGFMTLSFNSLVENAKLSGIEIVSASGGSSAKGVAIDNTNEESINPDIVQKINIPILSPNPATTEVTISFSPGTNDSIESVSIYDLSGRLIANYTAKDLISTTEGKTINISGLADGVYPVTIRTQSLAIFQYRLVVEKQ